MTRVHLGARFLGMITLFAGLLALSACGPGAPEEEMAATQATIDSVRALPVVQSYGQNELREAEQQLARVRQLVADKRYEEAQTAVVGAKSQARSVVAGAEKNRDAAQRDAEQSIAAARQAIEGAVAAIPTAPRWGKGAIRDLSALKADVENAEGQLQSAEQQLEALAYREASAAARNASQLAGSVTRTVEDAIALRESVRRR
jgi:hypothetical protein